MGPRPFCPWVCSPWNGRGLFLVVLVQDLQDGIGQVVGLFPIKHGAAVATAQNIGVAIGLPIGLDLFFDLADQAVHFGLAALLQELLLLLQLLAHKLATLLQLPVLFLGVLLGHLFGLGLKIL